MPPGPSSATDTRANGSVSSWPGYCTGVTTVKLTTVPWSPSSTSSSVVSLITSIGQKSRGGTYTRPQSPVQRWPMMRPSISASP